MRILVRSVHDAFQYVMQHYYPAGLEEEDHLTDTYAVISIQDTHTGGFGVEFCRNQFCEDVLTLRFDDVWKEVDGAVMFSEEMAESVIRFIKKNRHVDTLLIHCYAGQSRSRAVGLFAIKLLGGDNSKALASRGYNQVVYDTLVRAWEGSSHE